MSTKDIHDLAKRKLEKMSFLNTYYLMMEHISDIAMSHYF